MIEGGVVAAHSTTEAANTIEILIDEKTRIEIGDRPEHILVKAAGDGYANLVTRQCAIEITKP